ncbi:MAG: NAD-dependent epimerase/dehydratase [Candidatus Saccharibacteria bacterium]|nr:NAD-dependent epimerase/dehydratase [Candidatus Saccharibacteria bacterium]
MKILIVGANSTVAKAVISKLTNEHTVITAGRKDCDLIFDLRKSIKIPKDVDAIFNFTAAFGGESNDDIRNTFETNVLGALNLCIAAADAGIKHIIQLSSVSALIPEGAPYYSIYGLTKKQADEVMQLYCKNKGIALTIVRPSQIYGESDVFARHQPFIYLAADLAQKGEDITIYGQHDALRNYIFIDDLTEVLCKIVAKKIDGVFLCTYPDDVSYGYVAEVAQKVFHGSGAVKFLKDKPNIPDNVFPRDESIYEKTGYMPKIDLEEGFRRIKAYRSKVETSS